MQYREALLADIPQLTHVRLSVQENVLSDPSLVTEANYIEYLTVRGKGWVCSSGGQIVGFAIADLQDHNVWALFVLPQYAGMGIGKQLHNIMLNWYFGQTQQNIWLGTAFNTRAEKFYRIQGWLETGSNGSKEIRFEMSYKRWQQLNS